MPNDSDVLCGRGGRNLSHPGNENYRKIIFQNKERHALCRKMDKIEVSKEIVCSFRNRNPPSRFLEHNLESSQWEELSEERAIAKVSMALREGQKDIRSLEARIDPENVTSTDKSPNRERNSNEAGYSSHSTADANTRTFIAKNINQIVRSQNPPGRVLKFDLSTNKWNDICDKKASRKTRQALLEGLNQMPHLTRDTKRPKRFEKEFTIEDSPNFNEIHKEHPFPTAERPINRKQKKNIDNAIMPNDSDVLCGRGGRTFSHPGNENYRHMIFQNKERYVLCRKMDKIEVSKEIVCSFRNRNPPSRFLEHNLESSQWEELSEERAIAKVSQALREGQKDIRRSLEARTNPENVTSTDKSPNRERNSNEAGYSSHSTADANTRTFIAKNINQIVRSQNPSGRVLKFDLSTNNWNGIGDKKASRKTRQALLEGLNQMPHLMREMKRPKRFEKEFTIEDSPNFNETSKEHPFPTAELQINVQHATHDSCDSVHCQASNIMNSSTSGSLQPLENTICPHHNDVLNGGGKFAMQWNGNRICRELVQSNKSAYLEADDDARTVIATNIMKMVRSQNPPGRFLRLDSTTNKWNDIGNANALRKTRKVLQEGSNLMVNSGSAGSSYDESKYDGVLPPNNHLEIQDKIPNEVKSSSVEDANQSKQKSEMLAHSSLITTLFNYISNA